jgi:hypothetical protein
MLGKRLLIILPLHDFAYPLFCPAFRWPFWQAGRAMKTLHDLVADKLEQADAAGRAALLPIPLENIDRWLANGHTAPHRLEQWRQILLRAQASEDGFRELLVLLRDPSERAQKLKDFAPFAGILSREARRQAAPECAYNF